MVKFVDTLSQYICEDKILFRHSPLLWAFLRLPDHRASRTHTWRKPAIGLGLLTIAFTSGCQSINSSSDLGLQPSSNPVTVENVSRHDRLAQLGAQQHPRILETYGGEYKDAKLERMVAKIVGKLTTVSDKPDQTYRITILDSPNINAFALPGGFLYVTRGLLALANDSSEVAAVIA